MNQEDQIKELEKQIAEIKKKELFEKWENYLLKLKSSLDLLKNKTILSWHSRTGFTLFKIKDIQEKYYIDCDGYYGQFSPKRWLEIVTEGYLVCSTPEYRPKIEQLGDFNNFKFKKITGKTKNELSICKVQFHDESLNRTSYGELERCYKVGFTEYKEYSDNPNYDRSLDFLKLFSYVVSDELWDNAYQIHLDNVNKTIDFWNKYEKEVKVSKKVSDILS